jgi:hypothetical protein
MLDELAQLRMSLGEFEEAEKLLEQVCVAIYTFPIEYSETAPILLVLCSIFRAV